MYLSLGSNLGDRHANLQAALERLHPVRTSRVYETAPVDHTDQPFFLNLAAEVETAEEPEAYLERAQTIERELGRVRSVQKGPRTVDIDILFWGDRVIRSERLEIPHPRIADRRFVLVPMAELDAGLRHPLDGRTIAELLRALPETDDVQLWQPTPAA